MSATSRSVLAVWLLLMASTAASTWWLSQPVFPPKACTLAVMLIAAAKAGLVMSHFMELRGAPRPWQLAGVGWLIVAAGAVIGIYLM